MIMLSAISSPAMSFFPQLAPRSAKSFERTAWIQRLTYHNET